MANERSKEERPRTRPTGGEACRKMVDRVCSVNSDCSIMVKCLKNTGCKSPSAMKDVTHLHTCRHIQEAENNVFPLWLGRWEVAADLSEAPRRMPKVR